LFKSVTARELFKKFLELKRELWGGEFWSDGYYLGTVGEKANWLNPDVYEPERLLPLLKWKNGE
jgi:putative transposase